MRQTAAAVRPATGACSRRSSRRRLISMRVFAASSPGWICDVISTLRAGRSNGSRVGGRDPGPGRADRRDRARGSSERSSSASRRPRRSPGRRGCHSSRRPPGGHVASPHPDRSARFHRFTCSARKRRAPPAARRGGAREVGRLGTTLDEAAGEAFDKGARLLGLGTGPGRRSTRPGEGDPTRLTSRSHCAGLDFSFRASRPHSCSDRDLGPDEDRAPEGGSRSLD